MKRKKLKVFDPPYTVTESTKTPEEKEKFERELLIFLCGVKPQNKEEAEFQRKV